MTPTAIIQWVPIPLLFILTILLSLACIELGFWLGGRRRKRQEQEPDSPVGATVGATLGLLAFTLAFTFGMAMNRHDARKQLVLDEANAIGTTYLRAALLPASDAAEVRRLLREYVNVRLEAVTQHHKYAEAIARSEQLHNLLWRHATAVGTGQPQAITVGLFIQSLNDVIDLHAMRVAAWRNRVPGTIWFFVYLTAALGMSSVGYHGGLSGPRRTVTVLFLAIAFSGVLTLIEDLDRPQQGLLRVSQQALLDLQKSLQVDAEDGLESSGAAP